MRITITNHLLATALCCTMVVFFSTSLLAQTFPTSCTSKDLTLLKASLPAPVGNRCACSGDRSLILGIHNGTGSTRTSFALWGTLVKKNASGTVLSSQSLFACAGPIPPTGDYFLNATTIIINGETLPPGTGGYPLIHINCGESLDILDMHLAWTSATPGATCDLLYANPSTINPKCGTQDLIHVDLGLEAGITTTQSTCTTKGQIVISPNGGLVPYQVCLYRKASPNATDSILRSCITVNGTTTTTATFTGLGDSSYTAVITDNMSADASLRCSINRFATIANPDNVSTPNATVQNPGCNATTGTVNVTSPVSGVTYTLLQSAVLKYTANSSGVFSGVIPGTYDLKATKGVCTATNAGAVVVANPPSNPTFTVSITQPTLCDKGSLTITPSGGSGFTYRINGTSFDDVNANKNNTGVFNNLVTGDVTAVQVKNSAGCLSDVKTCAQVSAAITNKAKPEPVLQVYTNDNPSVLAYPNPFNDHVKFVVSAPKEGKGSLEIYNMLGQKLKTVYQGHINAGSNAFELSLPKKDQATLIYIFRVGDKKITGKLLQLNN